MAKRKSSTALAPDGATIPPPILNEGPPPKRRASQRKVPQMKPSTNPDENANVLDAPEAFRASPDADEKEERINLTKAGVDVSKQIKEEDDFVPSLVENGDSESSLSDVSELESLIKARAMPKPIAKGAKVVQAKVNEEAKVMAPAKAKESAKEPQFLDPEADGEEEADEEEIQAALSRPPPVNSDYLPLPWKGRLGYACLNTYLRFSNPPVFSSRTCRIASILENRHPLRDPNAPPHATKNRPDREQPADIRRGQEFVEQLCLANVRDIPKMLRWNDRYGIKFLRLSSEMFPFASHPEYGYKLAPFASDALAEAGKVAAELGHRLTTHPGQYTQLGSPRKSVIDNALRDLDYHAEMLSLLKLPKQANRDAVMILHLGGVFGDKAATLDRFRENYAGLPQGVKDRLVLENDDVSWSVHDLLPLCEELNIPLVLDFHHHNIIFDAEHIREGTADIRELFPRILATWKRKNITPKMHYSEPCPNAITGRQRRKHSPRVATLPPCPPDMDLMIEAKDKEQAVFELMRVFKLPGYDTFNDILPHVRQDDNKPLKTPAKKKKTPKKGKADNDDVDEEPQVKETIEDDEVGMGGPQGRVYWPPSMEHWLRPQKREIKPKDPDAEGKKAKGGPKTKAELKAAKEAKEEASMKKEEGGIDGGAAAVKTTPAMKKKAEAESKRMAKAVEAEVNGSAKEAVETELNGTASAKKSTKKAAPAMGKSQNAKASKKIVKEEEEMEEEIEDEQMPDLNDEDELEPVVSRSVKAKAKAAPKRASGRKEARKRKSYVESEGE